MDFSTRKWGQRSMSTNEKVGTAAVIIGIGTAVLVASNAGVKTGGGGPSPTPTPTPTPTTLKGLLRGCLDRGGVPQLDYRTSLGGYVITGNQGTNGAVTWAEMVDSSGNIVAGNPWDVAIEEMQTWNSANPQYHQALKGRVLAGVHVPSGVLDAGGTPVMIYDPTTGNSGLCPRFWEPGFLSAASSFEAEMVAKYGAILEIAEFVFSPLNTFYSEPFIRQIADAQTVAALVAAGFDASIDEPLQLSQTVARGTAWRSSGTRVAATFNPYQVINADGSTGTDETFTAQAITNARSTLGSLCSIENNSIRYPESDLGSDYVDMYGSIQSVGGPIGFQTATSAKVGDLPACLADCAVRGATHVELPGGYEALMSSSQIAAAGAALAANCPTC